MQTRKEKVTVGSNSHRSWKFSLFRVRVQEAPANFRALTANSRSDGTRSLVNAFTSTTIIHLAENRKFSVECHSERQNQNSGTNTISEHHDHGNDLVDITFRLLASQENRGRVLDEPGTVVPARRNLADDTYWRTCRVVSEPQ